MISQTKIQRLIILLLCLVMVRGVIYGLVIPFDRTPDEYYHFQLIQSKALQLRQASDQEKRRVAAEMALTKYYLQNPEAHPSKRSVQDFMGVPLPKPPSSLNIYYALNGWILKTFALDNVREEIFLIRGLSVLCGMVVVLLSFLTAREIFPDSGFMLIGVPAFLTFLPQFSAMNGAINNDNLAELFAALLFWVMVKIFKSGLNQVTGAMYIVVMGCALLSKRTTVFMLPLLLMLVFIYYWRSSFGLRMHLILLVSIFVLSVTGFFLLSWNSTIYEFIDTYVIHIPIYAMKEFSFYQNLCSGNSLKYYAKFFIVIYWSFWGVFGYMTIHLHHFWYLLAGLAQSFSLYGLIRNIGSIKKKRVSLEKWKIKVLYLFGASIVLVVAIMFLRSVVFRPQTPSLAQGRRLFTAIIPISVLTLWGLENCLQRRFQRWVGAVGLVGLLLLDSVCLFKYLLLNFHHFSLL